MTWVVAMAAAMAVAKALAMAVQLDKFEDEVKVGMRGFQSAGSSDLWRAALWAEQRDSKSAALLAVSMAASMVVGRADELVGEMADALVV